MYRGPLQDNSPGLKTLPSFDVTLKTSSANVTTCLHVSSIRIASWRANVRLSCQQPKLSSSGRPHRRGWKSGNGFGDHHFFADPLQTGRAVAPWAIASIGIVEHLPTFLATLHVARTTPASPPWAVTGLLMASLLRGLILALLGLKETKVFCAKPGFGNVS